MLTRYEFNLQENGLMHFDKLIDKWEKMVKVMSGLKIGVRIHTSSVQADKLVHTSSDPTTPLKLGMRMFCMKGTTL